MKVAVATCLVAASVLSAEVARADSFTMPGAFSTRGIFTCAGFGGLACTGSGTDTLTLGSGTNLATLTFEGVDREIAITNRARPVTLGTFVVDGPDDFTFPTRVNDNLAIIRFDFTMAHTVPEMITKTTRLAFGPGGDTRVRFQQGATYMSFPFPAEFRTPSSDYGRFLYSFNLTPFFIEGNGRTDLTADVGVVPEPATMLLVGAGLAGALARRRRKENRLQPLA